MLLSELLSRIEILERIGPSEREVAGVHFDSRAVGPGDLYVAAPGTRVDGHEFIDAVVAAGAGAVLCERLPATYDPDVTYLRVASARYALGLLANAWHGYPSESLTLVGVTGTNGKTTTATLLYRLFQRLGHRVGLLSTIRNYAGDEVVPSTHTTGDALQIASLMARMVAANCTLCFMEVTSHAVDQHRIAGLRYRGALFTNLTHDHLDYHGTLEAYRDVKKSYFDSLPDTAFALTNADDPVGDLMISSTRAARYRYGTAPGCDFPLELREAAASGMRLRIAGHDIATRLVGAFNASNLAAVFGAAVLLGENPDQIAIELAQLDPVEGRMERIDGPDGITAVVDFAHTPDALEKAIAALRGSGEGRPLICVIGCGGDRDAEKRPIMGQIVARDCDQAVFTADNPRSESPETILAAMLANLTADELGRVQVVADRRSAIEVACHSALPGAIVLIAGKGHEKYQEIAGEKLPFDDCQCAHDALASRVQRGSGFVAQRDMAT